MSQVSTCCNIFRTVDFSALPLGCINRRILIKLLPPHSVVLIVERNIGEDGIFAGASQRIRIGLLIGARCNTEETILRIDGIQSAVLARFHPSDIVANGEYFVAVFQVSLRRNQHCQVGFAAGRGECSGDIDGFSVRFLYAEDQHVLSHPTLVLALVGSNTKRKAFFTEQNVSAVCGVNGPNSVFFRELYNVTVFRINICFGMQATDKVVGGVAKVFESLLAHSCHNVHIQNNIDGVCQLNANLCQRGTNWAHGIWDYIHGSALHNAVIQREQFCLHLFRIHPVVGWARIFFFLCANKSPILYTGNVVGGRSVIQATRKQLFVELNHFPGRNCLVAQLIKLLFGTVNPDNLVRLREGNHFVYPSEYVFVVGHPLFSFQSVFYKPIAN